MDSQQSFRTQLVDFLQEIIPFSNFDKYARKTREGIETNPNSPDNHPNHVTYHIWTARHSYSISATPTYLGCGASTTFYRPGEDWTRGNDLPDGKFCRETWEAIKDAIIRYELEKIQPTYAGTVPNGPSSTYTPTPAEDEYHAARNAVFQAQKRLSKAERALDGRDREIPTMPASGATAWTS